MPRGLKLWLGIPMVLLGIFVTLAGAAAMAVFGVDGTYQIRSGVDTTGHAIVFDGLSLRGLPEAGRWSAELAVEVEADDGEVPVFVGVGPREAVAAYLAEANVDRIVQLRPVGGVRTERVEARPSSAIRVCRETSTSGWRARRAIRHRCAGPRRRASGPWS